MKSTIFSFIIAFSIYAHADGVTLGGAGGVAVGGGLRTGSGTIGGMRLSDDDSKQSQCKILERLNLSSSGVLVVKWLPALASQSLLSPSQDYFVELGLYSQAKEPRFRELYVYSNLSAGDRLIGQNDHPFISVELAGAFCWASEVDSSYSFVAVEVLEHHYVKFNRPIAVATIDVAAAMKSPIRISDGLGGSFYAYRGKSVK